MSNLDYFRRPVLAGNTLARTQSATLRGSVRRNDADGVSVVPYFPGLSGTSLQIKIESTTYSVSFSGVGFADALASINAVIGGHGIGVANGLASDSDGSITLQSNSTNGLGAPLKATGSIEVVGGSAAAILGFDVSFHPLKAYGGELLGAAEGRVGNPFRTSFLSKNEALSVGSVNRNLAALAANSDVLFAHHNREDAVLQKVTSFTNNGSYLTVGAGVSVPTGFGLLTASATKEDLAPLFQIIDTQTKQPHASRVVAVVKGAPGAAYPAGWPYADQTVWSDNLGRNLLGTQLNKTPSGAAITGITEGRYVSCSGAPFTQVVAGDFVEVYGATNTDYLDNNGLRWVVESVISTSIIALRPMSKGELSLVGVSPATVQPSVDLADTKQSAQSYGSVRVWTGAFATVPALQPASLNLVVSPALAAGSSVELWMAQPRNLIDVGPYDLQLAAGQSFKQLASNLDPAPNGLLSSPTVTIGGASLTVGAFYARWHGRVVRVEPTVLTAPADAFCSSVIYWDEDSNSVKAYVASTSPGIYNATTIFSGAAVPSASTSGTAFPIAAVLSSSSVWAPIQSLSKVENGKKCTVTVGHGGDFDSIAEASRFLDYVGILTGESSTSNGAYPHFEIVLLSDQSQVSTVTFAVPAVTIRGANRSIRVISNMTSGNSVFSSNGGSFTVEDLTVRMEGGPQIFVEMTSSSAGDVVLRNVLQDMNAPAVSMLKVVRAPSSATNVRIEDCSFTVSLYIVEGSVGVGNISISRSTISHLFVAPYTDPLFVACDALTLRISESSFPAWKGGGNGIVFSDLVSPSLVDVSICNSRFDFGAQTSALALFMRAGSVRCLISNCFINMTGNAGINGATGDGTTIRDCTITTNVFGSGGGLNASRLLSNKVVLAADSVSNTNQYVIDQAKEVSGNSFSGTQPAYYVRAGDGAVVQDNYFNIGASSWLAQTTAVIDVVGDGVVSGNYIEGVGTCFRTIAITSRCSVTGNWVLSSGGCGIYVGAGECIIGGNTVNGPAEAINGSANDGNIVSNNVLVSATLPGALPFGGEFSGNVYNIGSMSFTRNSVAKELLIRDCTFVGNFEFTGSNISISGCGFTGTTIIQSRLDSAPLQMYGVHFNGSTTLVACHADVCVFKSDGTTAAFVGNTFLTGCTVSNSAFTAFSYSSDWVRVRNTTIIGCKSSCVISDHASLASNYNYVFDTYCYALASAPALFQGMFFSDRTYKLVVEGCDTATVNGDISTNSGPRDVSISNTRANQLWMGNSNVVTVTNCKVGLRNTTNNNSLSSRFQFSFSQWGNGRSTLTGTMTFGATTTVTGSGTKFKTEVQVGDIIFRTVDAPATMGRVVAIATDTSLTLASNYTGTAGSGTAYSGSAHGTFIGNDIYDPNGSNCVLDCSVAYGAWLHLSGNVLSGKWSISLATSAVTEKSLVTRLSMVGNTVSGTSPSQLVAGVTADPTYVTITGNQFDAGLLLDISGTGTWGTTVLFSGAVSNNSLGGALEVSYARGLLVTGNNIVCTPTNELLKFFRCMDIVVDSNYLYKTVSNGFGKLILFNDVRRTRLTNNVLGSAWVSPDGSELLSFVGNSGGSIGYDMIIMGNHMYFVGATAPSPTQASMIPSATVYFLLDTATSTTAPSRLGGTISSPTAP